MKITDILFNNENNSHQNNVQNKSRIDTKQADESKTEQNDAKRKQNWAEWQPKESKNEQNDSQKKAQLSLMI